MSYVEFNPPRGVEQYPERVSPEVIEEVARNRVAHQPPKYLVQGEWVYGLQRYLDVAINRAWVDFVTNYKLTEGRLRWTCPICGKLGGTHTKACDYER